MQFESLRHQFLRPKLRHLFQGALTQQHLQHHQDTSMLMPCGGLPPQQKADFLSITICTPHWFFALHPLNPRGTRDTTLVRLRFEVLKRGGGEEHKTAPFRHQPP